MGVSLPDGWFELTRGSMPEARCSAIRDAITQGEPIRALRLHKLADIGDIAPLPPVPWAVGGYLLPALPEIHNLPFGKHPLHAAGAYYLQEPSAMAPVAALDVQAGQRVLDLCAAPGGKSGQIAAALVGMGVLVANEPSLERARELRGNLARLGVTNAIITQEPPGRLVERFPEWFDRVLVDAPCSGEGMFRRSAAARRDWSVRAVKGCAVRQLAILEAAQSMLRPDGVMVYSTCAFNQIENDSVVQLFLNGHPEFTIEDFELPGLPSSEEGMLRITPDSGLGEGQFMARLRKTGTRKGIRPRLFDRQQYVLASERSAFEMFREGVVPGFGLIGQMFRLGGRVAMLPKDCPELERWVGLRVLAAGIDLGAARPHGWEPSYALGMAVRAEQASVAVALGESAAIAWVDGHDAPLAGSTAQASGWGLAVYHNLPLGFGKINDGRLKNKRVAVRGNH
ncbi:MAG: hypothetical protein LBS11_12180 [Oscillospiraceae bacterium]|jgi:16S rRNA C967 or C1407 C5-methylase (RsmB/RsmF family)/NOL1/NOP2/fmu family ribosome biogenesis protein|nr:hypothetical protein [Oscillospiraceae bacterium]